MAARVSGAHVEVSAVSGVHAEVGGVSWMSGINVVLGRSGQGLRRIDVRVCGPIRRRRMAPALAATATLMTLLGGLIAVSPVRAQTPTAPAQLKPFSPAQLQPTTLAQLPSTTPAQSKPFSPPQLQAFAAAGVFPLPPWRQVNLPDLKFPATRFAAVEIDGQSALRVEAEGSYGNLVHPLAWSQPAGRLAWRWRVDELNAEADLRRREGDDTTLKVCLMFDLPLANVPFLERQLLRLARSRSSEPLPAATLCYLWDARLPAGTTLDNAYTRRVRFIVLQGGVGPQPAWRQESRDIAADFMRLFGDEAAQVPPLVAVLVGADADNTQGRSRAHVADLRLLPP